MKHADFQAGFSLLEMLAALALSSALILGMTQLYLDSRRLHQQLQTLSHDLDTARYTLTTLENNLRRAGYQVDPARELRLDFPAHAIGDCRFAAGEFIHRIGADMLCLRYQSRYPQERDCEGNIVAAVAGEKDGRVERLQYDRESGALYCRAVASGSALTGKGAALAEGLAGLRFDISYGQGGRPAILRYSILLTGQSRVTGRAYRAHVFWCREWAVPGQDACNGDQAANDDREYMFFSRSLALRQAGI